MGKKKINVGYLRRFVVKDGFFKIISHNSIVFFSKVFSSFIISKTTAVFLGPSGYALLGNFKNILQIVLGVSTNGFQSGIIKYVSENQYKTLQLKKVISSAFALNVLICLLIAPFFLFFSDRFASYILKDVSLAYVFEYLAFFLPLISLNSLLVYTVIGLQKLKLYTRLSVVLNIFNAGFTFLFVYYFKLQGALFASFIVPSITLIAALLFKDIRVLFLNVIRHFRYVSFKIIKSFSVYMFMAIYSSTLISLSYLMIRNIIIKVNSIESAGVWEASNKISSFYMLFFSSLFTLYLLPKLSKNNSIIGYSKIMKNYFSILLPILVMSFIVLFFLKYILIKIFLANSFFELGQYFHLQLIGDFFRVIAFSLAYQFHAKKMILAYFITDALLYGGFYVFSALLIQTFNLNGVFYAYVLSAVVYFVSVLLFVINLNPKYLMSKENE